MSHEDRFARLERIVARMCDHLKHHSDCPRAERHEGTIPPDCWCGLDEIRDDVFDLRRAVEDAAAVKALRGGA